MLGRKIFVSLGIVTALSMPTSAFAFQSFSPSSETSQNIIYVNGDSLENRAQVFISNLTKEGIGFLEDEKTSKEKREKNFRNLLKKSFDMKTIGRFALGRYWKTSSKAEQKEYLKLFENMIVEVYSRRFSEYNGQIIEIVSSRPTGKSDALVSSVIIPTSGPEIDVDWRVRKKKNGTFKVIDIMVEGVSMSLTQRSDFASVIQRGGGKIEVLLKHLRPKE